MALAVNPTPTSTTTINNKGVSGWYSSISNYWYYSTHSSCHVSLDSNKSPSLDMINYILPIQGRVGLL